MASIRIADPMLPSLAAEFSGSPADAAATITGFALAYGAMQLVFGPFGDRVGKLRVITGAALAAAIGSLLCALAPTLPLLVAARFVTGACCAGIIPLSLAWIGDTFAYERRQETLARFATGTLMGLIAGQALGGIAADTIGWRGAFVGLALLFGGFGWRLHRLARRDATAHLGQGHPGQASPPLPSRPGLLSGYATVLRSRWALFVLAMSFTEGALLFGGLAFVPTWLHLRFEIALSAAGLMVAAVGVGGLLFTLGAKRWIRRLGERGMSSFGGLAIGAGLIGLATAELAGVAPVALVVLVTTACLVTGFGFYMLHNTLQALATQLAPEARGTAVGLFAVSLFIGQAAGVAGAAIMAARIGYPATFTAAGALLALLGATVGAAVSRRANRTVAAAR